jgi:hypothetical protein
MATGETKAASPDLLDRVIAMVMGAAAAFGTVTGDGSNRLPLRPRLGHREAAEYPPELGNLGGNGHSLGRESGGDEITHGRAKMKFDVYGRFQVEVVREGDGWVAYRLAPGKRTKLNDLIIPASLEAGEIAVYLDDLYHEAAKPGDLVRIVDQP